MSDVMGILERKIRFAAARHGVLASNVANADTPGFRARDLRFEEALEGEGLSLRRTAPGHLGGADPGSRPAAEEAPAAPWGDGNTVELDAEMAKMTENALLYQAGVTMLSAHIRMFRQALRRTP